jgi:biotin carboxyl carrier protein
MTEPVLNCSYLDAWKNAAAKSVMTAQAAELPALMPDKAPPDLSHFLLAPMPGLLVDVAVKVGQEVRAGECRTFRPACGKPTKAAHLEPSDCASSA